jgi:hypothetical protein
MKIGTIERTQTVTTDIELHEARLHFADDSTPAESGGPGALIIDAPGMATIRLPATDPVVVALVAKLGGEVAKAPGAKLAAAGGGKA